MNSSLFSDELNRRRFVSLAAKSFLGLSILPWASHSSLSGAGLGLNRPLNHAPKAKNVIMLFMEGGPSQVDTFDPKPMLRKWHGKLLPNTLKTERVTGAAMGSPAGRNGAPLSERNGERVARQADGAGASQKQD